MKNHIVTILVFATIGLAVGLGVARFKDQKALKAAIKENKITPRSLDLRISDGRKQQKVSQEALKANLEEQSVKVREEEFLIIRKSLTVQPSNL